ncbi:tyrosine-type recombinase/integrase [Dictyobacter kobayashii]|uniref:tyrosine-type recombinase/integrase n=1 Tax=Dictyobacter kobayashii TaxID=2014872 RepID=UPI00353083B9
MNEWEQVRPKGQPSHLDRKTGELVQFLFSYRGVRVAKSYINNSLIPHLCRKAGIPEQDSRGNITSHRARASIASQLYNAKEPLTIYELMQYLSHKRLLSTQHYVQVDPTKLASKVTKTGYLEQNLATIEVLLDKKQYAVERQHMANPGSTTTWVMATVSTISGPSANTVWPAPAVPFTVRKSLSPTNFWKAKRTCCACWSLYN